MKTMKLAITSALVLLGSATIAHAQDFDSLGSNQGVLKRAQSMSTKQQVRIVQKRAVDRDMRLELGAYYGGVSGGNSYINTQPFMGALDFHFTPRISAGLRYTHFANQLTREGENQFALAQKAKADGSLDYSIPAIDFPISSTMAVFSYYPIYGKLNFFDLTVVQFDLYATVGYGQMQLNSGSSDTWTAGGGVGFWWTNHISSRFEVRHQAYQDRVYTGARDISMLVGTFGIGILL